MNSNNYNNTSKNNQNVGSNMFVSTTNCGQHVNIVKSGGSGDFYTNYKNKFLKKYFHFFVQLWVICRQFIVFYLILQVIIL